MDMGLPYGLRPSMAGGSVVESGGFNPLTSDGVDQSFATDAGGFFDVGKFFDKYNEAARQATEQQRIWSAEQAQKQMDFQRDMASTQYQRAAEDMKLAGLNPYMLMTGAAASASPSGAMATTSTQDVYSNNDVLQRDLAILDAVMSLVHDVASVIGSGTKKGSFFK